MSPQNHVYAQIHTYQQKAIRAHFWKSILVRLFFLVTLVGVGDQAMKVVNVLM